MPTAALARANRVDRFALRLDAGTVTTPPNMPGVVDVWGVATRVGVFIYGPEDVPGLKPGEVLREYRPPEEVFDEESLASLVGIPFTVDHPSDSVTSATWRDLAHGNVLEFKVEGSLVWVRVRIASEDAKAAIEAGKVELSCGYSAFLDDAPGVTPDGLPYDVVQREIRYNHLALVDLARAGHVARLKFDGKAARVQRNDGARKGPRPMKFTIQIDGKTYTVSPLLVPGLSAESEATAKKIRHGDAIETSEITFTDPDGGAPVKLILPKGTVEEMLAMIGAAGAPAAAAPMEGSAMGEEEPPPAGEPGLLEEDGTEDEGSEPPPPRMDRASVEAMIAAAVAKAVPAELTAREDRARERADLERRTSGLLGESYRFDAADDLEVTLDAIERADSSKFEAAKALVGRARKGDERARGRLDAMLDSALESGRVDNGDSADTLGAVFRLRQDGTETEAIGSTIPRHEQIRQDRIAKASKGA